MHASILKYFIEVARSGSLRKASEELFIAASAVNRQILKLEEELGTELFDRLPNGLRINAAGQRFLKHAEATLHDYQVMRTEIGALRGDRTGHIKLAAMDSFFEEVLPSAIAEFQQLFPAVTYTINASHPADVAPMVVSGQFDVGLSFVSRLPAGVSAMALSHLPPGVVMAPGHPLASQEWVSLEDCARYPFLRFSKYPVFSSLFSPEYAEFWDALEPVATCNYSPLVKQLIGAGAGISVFSKIALMKELRAGELVWRPFSVPEINAVQVGVIVPVQRELPAATQNFVGRLARRLAQLEAAAAAV